LIEVIEPLRPYEFEKVETKETLFKVMKIESNIIDYGNYFICSNNGLSLFKKSKLISRTLFLFK